MVLNVILRSLEFVVWEFFLWDWKQNLFYGNLFYGNGMLLEFFEVVNNYIRVLCWKDCFDYGVKDVFEFGGYFGRRQ